MSEKKNKFGELDNVDDNKALRARNKTVMLTPEIANEMRTRLSQGIHQSTGTEEINKDVINHAKEVAKSAGIRVPDKSKFDSLSPGSMFKNPVEDEKFGRLDTKLDLPIEEDEQSFEIPKEFSRPEDVRKAAYNQSSHNEINDSDQDIDEDHSFRLGDIPRENASSTIPKEFSRPEDVRKAAYNQYSHNEINDSEEYIEEDHSFRSGGTSAREIASSNIPSRSIPQPKEAIKREAPVQPKKLNTGDFIDWVKESPVCGFLVSFDKNPNGDVFNLHSGRLVVTSEAPSSGNVFYLDDESVSPMHAVLRISPKGEIQVLDQLSEAGTRIERLDGEVLELSGDKANLQHGDLLSFGQRTFKVCLIDG